jgi:hypothetical protein
MKASEALTLGIFPLLYVKPEWNTSGVKYGRTLVLLRSAHLYRNCRREKKKKKSECS